MTRKSFKLVTPSSVGISTVSYHVEKSTNGAVPEYQNQSCRETEENDEDRGGWGKTFEFLFSCISMSVGLGNVWRFPGVAYKNGGGAFLIPYLIVLILVGRPLYYLELSLGQFSSQGPVKLWRCVPALKGVGVAQLISTVYIMVFYNYLMAITIYYLFASMQNPLPWKVCSDEWAIDCDAFNQTSSVVNGTIPTLLSKLYYKKAVLKETSGLEEMSEIHWWLALSLLLAWILVYCCIVRGVASVGKVAYFTASFPYVVLISLLIVALTARGSGAGIGYFFTPQWDKLLNITVWYEACKQAFFSLNIGFGALIMFSSYNDFRHNVGRDAIIISVMDTFTSLLAGSVVFAVLGTLAEDMKVGVDVVAEGAQNLDLAFVAYPEALARIPFVPQLWSVLFFFMLFTLGIGSSMAQMETILTPLRDKFPALRKRKWLPSLVMCLIGFFFGLTLTTDAGSFVMNLLDNYGVGTGVFLYGIVEIVGIMWIYGLKNICLDIEYMSGHGVSIFWKATWGFITIITLVVIFIYGNVVEESNKIPIAGMPLWGDGLGWALAGVAIIQIPLWMFWTIITSRGNTLFQMLKSAFSPTSKWGPKRPDDYVGWLEFKRERLGQFPHPDAPPAYDNTAFDEKSNNMAAHSS